jgi:hypothetical protein
MEFEKDIADRQLQRALKTFEEANAQYVANKTPENKRLLDLALSDYEAANRNAFFLREAEQGEKKDDK